MLKVVGQFGQHYKSQAQGTLESLVVTPTLLSRVIESQGQDTKILSIRDQIRSDTGDESWVIHIDSSLRYRG